MAFEMAAMTFRQNRRNPRQGIETHRVPGVVPFQFGVRIDEIPVRGLKLLKLNELKLVQFLVRIDEIPVRGLKRIASP